MRGLPPPPATVLWYRQGWTCNGSPCSTGLWFFAPELPSASLADIDSVAGQLRNLVLELVADLASANLQDSDLTVLQFGERPSSIRSPSTGFVGSRGASSPLNASLGLYWQTGERGKSGRALTHVPGFPLSFTDDDVHVNGTAHDAARTACAGFLVGLEGVSAGAILSVALATLHRSRAGQPLPHSEIALINGGSAAPRIAGVQRRLR